MKRLYILTGGSGTGKSTVLEILRKRGYPVVEEQARKAFAENPHLSVNEPQVQVFLAQRQISDEKALPSRTCFLDRSIIDNLAYLALHKQKVPKELAQMIKKAEYEKQVFLFSMPPREQFGKKGQTYATYETALKIHRLLIKAYEKQGYHLINVPFAHYEEQVQFIEEKIGQIQN